MVIPDFKRVTLEALDHGDDLQSAGLLFNQEEIGDLVHRKYPSSRFVFEPSFFDTLFNISDGHVGAFCDFVRAICGHGVSFF